MLWINEDECVGCGVCVSVCPTGFELVEDKARVTDEAARCVDDAISACPQGAIVRLAQGEAARPRPVATPFVPAPAVQGPVGTARGVRPRFGRGRGRGRQSGGGRGRGRR